MAQPQMLQIKLSRFDAQPWGFRLQGGVDFAAPLLVQKVNGGSLAEQAGLIPGDAVLKINDVDVFNLRHKDAQDIVVRSGNNFVMTIQRGGSTWRPHITPVGSVPQQNSPYLQTVTKTSLAHKQQDSQHIGCGYNNAARPFANGSADGNVKSIVNKQYNTPVGIYSDESIAETLSAQAEVLAGGVLGVNFKKNEKEYQGEKSEVLKFLREEESGPSTPAFNNHQYQEPQQQQQYQPHQQQHQYQPPQQSATRHVSAPVNSPKPPSTGGLPVGQNICADCERLITGVFVRIKDKNLHVECFKCATCGTSLKNQGYYNFNNKLYCDIHAKLAAMQNPPSGTEGYVPVPMKPNTKLSASTISSALNSSHGFNGFSNGSSTPTPAAAPVNQGYARPFGSSAAPPAAAPKSPVSYPPQNQQWGAPQPVSKPVGSPYATLPRSNVGQQDSEKNLQAQYAEEEFYDIAGSCGDESEMSEANRHNRRNFAWPPPDDDIHNTPTAAPLYIPPPETQHVISRPVQQTFMYETKESIDQMQVQQQVEEKHWQSLSAPQLTASLQAQEMESSSDSYTSTCTTTTTTSEEYQRMYAAQVEAYQLQQAYDQSGSEIDYHMDMEVASMEPSQSCLYPFELSGRRSAQECVEALVAPITTNKLIDMVREVTPSPAPPSIHGPRHVVFAEEPDIREVPISKSTENHECNRESYLNPVEMHYDDESAMESVATQSNSAFTEEHDELVVTKRGDILDSQRIFQPTPEINFEIAPVRQIPPTKIPNPVPKEWINPMVRALTTAPEEPFHMIECPIECQIESKPPDSEIKKKDNESIITPSKFDSLKELPDKPNVEIKESEILRESPPRGSFLTKAVSTAPEFSVNFLPKASEDIPLPEETMAYMPPPIDMKPYMREDYRPKSPFLSALTVAPEKPFEGNFDRDVPIHLLDLPTPKEHLSMSDALRTASDRAYTPLCSDNATTKLEEEQKKKNQQKYEFQVLDREDELGLSTEAFQQTTSYASNLTQASRSSLSTACGTNFSTASNLETQAIIEETADALEHSEVLFPPPSPLSHLKSKPVSSGLHKADTIPKYQRNWTVLPAQSPIRTPEPPELRENVPLAFVDSPKLPTAVVSESSNPILKPVAQISTSVSNSSNHQQKTAAAANSSITSSSSGASSQQVTEQRQQRPSIQTPATQQQTKLSVPIIIEDRSCPVTMAFQSIDDNLLSESQVPSRPYTPSLTNKPAPIIPFYQTPEKLCFDECPATHARAYDRRSASPFPDRARSPAPGPPPNPLSAIRAPRMKENEQSPMSPRVIQTGSITTGQSYLGAQQAQKQEELLSYTSSAMQSAQKVISHKPEITHESRIGDMTIRKHEKQSNMEEQKQSQMQSLTKTQMGNTQIERRRKVTEEYEHTQSAKTVEVRTSSQSSTDRRPSYGKTGYVANEARRLSGLEQEITNLTSQSQAISARAAAMGDSSFPELKSPEPTSKFPLKQVFPPHNEPEPPNYILSGSTDKTMVGPPPGFQKQQQQLSTAYGTSLVSSQQQQQQKSLSAFSSTTTTTSSSLSSQANAVSCSLTKAYATNNQAFSASANCGSNSTNICGSACSGICPVTGTLCRPGQACCKQQLTAGINNTSNNVYRPNASTGNSSFKPLQATAAQNNAAAAAPQPVPAATNVPSVVPNIIDNSNVGGSAGGKGGAFGATSAPKRGKGTWNKAVAPGVRVPLCHSCNIQIRGPFITALGKIWCPEHFICVNANCRRPLQDIGFVEEKGDLYCEYCFEKYLAPTCSKCAGKIKGDCLNAIGRHFHPECFNCSHCGKIFGNSPFFLEDGNAYCEADWNELFTTKCFACGFPVEAGDRWVEALNHNYHSQCFNCTFCKQNLEGQSFYNKGGRPFCKNHAR